MNCSNYPISWTFKLKPLQMVLHVYVNKFLNDIKLDLVEYCQ